MRFLSIYQWLKEDSFARVHAAGSLEHVKHTPLCTMAKSCGFIHWLVTVLLLHVLVYRTCGSMISNAEGRQSIGVEFHRRFIVTMNSMSSWICYRDFFRIPRLAGIKYRCGRTQFSEAKSWVFPSPRGSGMGHYDLRWRGSL